LAYFSPNVAREFARVLRVRLGKTKAHHARGNDFQVIAIVAAPTFLREWPRIVTEAGNVAAAQNASGLWGRFFNFAPN
jgi:hypothetical protein